MNFITPTDDGISINLPVNGLQLELFAVFLMLVALSFAVMALPKVARTLPRLHDGTMANIGLWLGLLLAGCFAAVALYEFVSVVFRIPPYGENTDHAAAIRNIGLFTAAIFGAPFIAWRAIVAAKQVEVAEQSHITDQLAKAIEAIGATRVIRKQRKNRNDTLQFEDDANGDTDFKKPIFEEITEPNLEVRIGGLYALERIAQDSERDHIQIMEILCAYIRENSPAPNLESIEEQSAHPIPRLDIQTAATIISRRSQKRIRLEWQNRFRLNLTKSNLAGVDFSKGNLSAAMFRECYLEETSFQKANLEGTQFDRSHMNNSDFMRAKLKGTRFNNCSMKQSKPFSRGLALAEIHSIFVDRAKMEHSHLNLLDFQSNITFGSPDTSLGRPFSYRQKDYLDLREELYLGGLTLEEKAELRNSGFRYWSPLTSGNRKAGAYLMEFCENYGLTYWPHVE
ncbi:pentapeptide repeat-containing protein [Cochlodiniinecator piscidefendens]|uniref:pentapeptide repeat-containing protein n=1 Tax=Cochlodiniinecator piscidefendens TaxID=2715756 RepID=UPI00140A4003|nr:pentapeptide repeat-containing protein [Cochlodiniinecator piscidefendens]